MKLKRYLAFAGSEYYPSGGWGDFIGSFDTIEEARSAIAKKALDWAEIVDRDDTEREINAGVSNMALDQNSKRLVRKVRKVTYNHGVGWEALCWFGSDPATNLRVNIYRTRRAARKADVSDTYDNNPDLISFNVGGV